MSNLTSEKYQVIGLLLIKQTFTFFIFSVATNHCGLLGLFREMETLSSKNDCEMVCDLQTKCGNTALVRGASIIQVEKFDDVTVKYDENTYWSKSCQLSREKAFSSYRTFPCIWAIVTTVLFLVVLVIGAVTFVQLSAEIDHLKGQFVVSLNEDTRGTA